MVTVAGVNYPADLSNCPQITQSHCALWIGGNTPQGAQQGAQGFLQSTLYTSNVTNIRQPVVLRPFEPMSNSYVDVPAALGTGTNSGQAPWGTTLANHPPGVAGPYGVGSCAYYYSVSPSVVPSSGGTFTVTISTGAVPGTSPQGTCPWSAGPAPPATSSGISLPLTWPAGSGSNVNITQVNGGGCAPICWYSGGNGSVQFTLAANTSGSTRASVVQVAGYPITITQNAASNTVPISGYFYDWNGNLMPSSPWQKWRFRDLRPVPDLASSCN
jgi:hypothetical protein